MKPIDILLVEDSPGDVRLTREAIKHGRFKNELHVVGDGEEAMDFLHKRGAYINAPRPGLILLDLNLPVMDGREVLAEIKTDPSLRRIPVIVLTTSKADEDILKSYDLHANSYITKPVDYQQFISVIQHIEEFWLSIVSLPAEPL
jgi:chemotaxis family two-component system response regulator Rcp1